MGGCQGANSVTGLVLYPSLPDSFRILRAEDFWDGLNEPFSGNIIEVQTTDNQLRELRGVAERNGWIIVKEYVDHGIRPYVE